VNPLRFVPFFDWEDAEHVAGAVAGLVNAGIAIWNAVTGKDENASEGLVVTTSEGDVPLGEMLHNHEERLAKLEGAAKRRPRAKK